MKKFTHFESITYLWFLAFFENPDMSDVQITIKHVKIYENSKFKKKIEKIDPKASIWHRYRLNSSTSAIFTAVWNLRIFRIFDPIFENVPK